MGRKEGAGSLRTGLEGDKIALFRNVLWGGSDEGEGRGSGQSERGLEGSKNTVTSLFIGKMSFIPLSMWTLVK